MDFNLLLSKESYDPKDVLVFRHRPQEPELRKVLPWLAAEKPEVFNAHQRVHGSMKVQNALARMVGVGYVASFIGTEPGKATYAGLYRVSGATSISVAELWTMPETAELQNFGMKTPKRRPDEALLWFDLEQTAFCAEWKGKLVIEWPRPERVWWRRAHANIFPIRAIHEESVFEATMPAWHEMDLSWEELQVLPTRWKTAMSQWRGIYYIFDTSDGKGYVGSAYGESNLLGRWVGYAASGHGGNRLLKKRNPKNFRFTILERVSPDLDAEDVIHQESTWKDRLHTRKPWGLNEN